MSYPVQQAPIQIKDPYLLCEKLQQDQNVKIVDNKRTIYSDIILYDISLNFAGQEEDDEYATNEFYRKNIRRGNTIIQLVGKNDQIIQTFWGRRGQEKSFDLTREYIQYNLGEVKDFKNLGIKTEELHYKFHDLLFKDVKKAIQNDETIEVYSMQKLNGENAQVTFVKEKNCWLIASKNVSLLAAKRQDISYYRNEKRQHFAILIADSWFDILDDIAKEKVEQLKLDLTYRTLVGEYIGNQKCQHLVKYKEKTLHWFGVVPVTLESCCLDVETSISFFEHYNLKYPKSYQVGSFTDWNELNQTLKKIFDYISSQDIETEGEGCILYFTVERKNGNKEVLSLGKLKTLEYRIFRKLREKLRNYLENTLIKRGQLMRRFEQEVKELCNKVHPARDFKYYFDIAEAALDFIEDFPKYTYLIHEEYITFLSVIQFAKDRHLRVNLDMFENKEYKEKILDTPWSSFHSQSLRKPAAILAHKIQEKQKTIIAIIPIGLPGMGKSTFMNNIQQLYPNHVISIQIDKIRERLINELSYQNLSKDKKLEKTRISANQEYEAQIKDAIIEFQKSERSLLILCMDKNHPPNGIKKAVELIKGKTPYNFKLITIALIPKCLTVFDRQDVRLPFSFHFMLSCIQRVQQRKSHPTLVGENIHSIAVMFQFISMFKSFSLNEQLLNELGLNSVIKFPFVEESLNQDDYSQMIENDFVDMVKESDPDRKCMNKNLMYDFLDSLQQEKIELQAEDKNISQNIQLAIEEQLKKYSISLDFKNEKIEKETALPSQQITTQVKSVPVKQEQQTGAKQELVIKQEQGKKQVKKAYNPEYLPIYLGIFVVEQKSCIPKINSWIKTCLSIAKEKFPQDNDFESFKKQFIGQVDNFGKKKYLFQYDPHITLLYIDDPMDKEVRNLIPFKEFTLKTQHEIKLKTLFISPNNIITALVEPPTLPCQNKFPHMTLYCDQLKPKDSNDVISQAINSDSKVKEAYLQGKFLDSKQDMAFRVNFRYRGKDILVYIITTTEELVLAGESGEFYGKN